MLIPITLFFVGARLRAASSYTPNMPMDEMKTHLGTDMDMQMAAEMRA